MSEIKLYNDDCINVLKNIKDKTIDLNSRTSIQTILLRKK